MKNPANRESNARFWARKAPTTEAVAPSAMKTSENPRTKRADERSTAPVRLRSSSMSANEKPEMTEM